MRDDFKLGLAIGIMLGAIVATFVIDVLNAVIEIII